MPLENISIEQIDDINEISGELSKEEKGLCEILKTLAQDEKINNDGLISINEIKESQLNMTEELLAKTVNSLAMKLRTLAYKEYDKAKQYFDRIATERIAIEGKTFTEEERKVVQGQDISFEQAKELIQNEKNGELNKKRMKGDILNNRFEDVKIFGTSLEKAKDRPADRRKKQGIGIFNSLRNINGIDYEFNSPEFAEKYNTMKENMQVLKDAYNPNFDTKNFDNITKMINTNVKNKLELIKIAVASAPEQQGRRDHFKEKYLDNQIQLINYQGNK